MVLSILLEPFMVFKRILEGSESQGTKVFENPKETR
jgi:hypothetical protein